MNQSDYIDGDFLLDNFSFHLPFDQVRNISLNTGLTLNEVKAKLPFIVAGVLNIISSSDIQIRSELERIMKVRSQFFIPGERSYLKNQHESYSSTYFNDSEYALSSILACELDEAGQKISLMFGEDKEIVVSILTIISPYFLNQLSSYLGISEEMFKLSDLDRDYDTPVIKPIAENPKSRTRVLLSIKSLFLRLFKPILFLKKIATQIFAVLIFLILILIILFILSRTIKIPSIEESSSKKEVEKNINKELDNIDLSSDSAPLLRPKYPEGSPEEFLAYALETPGLSLPSKILKLEGFAYANNRVGFTTVLWDSILSIARIMKNFPNLKLSFYIEDNRLLASDLAVQNEYMLAFKKALLTNGASEDQLEIELLPVIKRSKKNGNSKVESKVYQNGLIYFRVSKL